MENSKAITESFIFTEKHGERMQEPEIRLEYVEELKRIDKEKGKRFKNIKELREEIEK